MKLTHTLSVLAVASMLLSGVPMAQAISISSSGTWTEATTNDGSDNVNGLGTNQISWGTPPRGGSQSSYIFEGSDGDIGHDALFDGESFKLGTFTHNNFPIFSNSPLLTDATLDLNLDIGGTVSNFTYVFNHNETPNNGSGVCPGGVRPCADIVTIPDARSSQSITVNGTDYNVEIVGFMDQLGDPIQDQFVTAENQSNTTMLFGRLTEVPRVPEPTTILGSALLLGVGIGLRKRQQA